MELLKKEDFKTLISIQTRWRDMDAFGHVNNAVFLTYSEDARIQYFKEWQLNTKEKSIILASVKIDFLRQLKHPAELDIGQKISRIGSKSFDISTFIYFKDEDEPIAGILSACVCFNYLKNNSVSVFDVIRREYEKN